MKPDQPLSSLRPLSPFRAAPVRRFPSPSDFPDSPLSRAVGSRRLAQPTKADGASLVTQTLRKDSPLGVKAAKKAADGSCVECLSGRVSEGLVSDNEVDQALKARRTKMQRETIFREAKPRGTYEKPPEKHARGPAEAASRARTLARKAVRREDLLRSNPMIERGR